MNKHTPGPWSRFKGRARWADNACVLIFGPDGKTPVAAASDFNSFDRDPEVEANADLLLAAPDLLTALQELLAYEAMTLEDVKLLPGGAADERAIGHVAMRKARAAIAKAMGATE